MLMVGLQLIFEVLDFFLNTGVVLTSFKSNKKLNSRYKKLCFHENI